MPGREQSSVALTVAEEVKRFVESLYMGMWDVFDTFYGRWVVRFTVLDSKSTAVELFNRKVYEEGRLGEPERIAFVDSLALARILKKLREEDRIGAYFVSLLLRNR